MEHDFITQSINQCLFVSNNPTDFPRTKALNRATVLIHAKYYNVHVEAHPAHTTTPAWIGSDQPNASGAGTDMMDQVNLAPLNQTSPSDTSQDAKQDAPHCHPSNRVTA